MEKLKQRERPLIAYDKERRADSPYYHSNGQPKRSAMMCLDKAYIKEVIAINGTYNRNWTCAGNRCPLYATGCDNRGDMWK